MTYSITPTTHIERATIIDRINELRTLEVKFNDYQATYTQDVDTVVERLKTRREAADKMRRHTNEGLLRRIVSGEEHLIADILIPVPDEDLQEMAKAIVARTGKKPVKVYDKKVKELRAEVKAARQEIRELTDKLNTIEAAIGRLGRVQQVFNVLVDINGSPLEADMYECIDTLIKSGFEQLKPNPGGQGARGQGHSRPYTAQVRKQNLVDSILGSRKGNK